MVSRAFALIFLLSHPFALGIIGLALGIVALQRLNEEQQRLNGFSSSPDVTFTMDQSDMFSASMSITVACGVITLWTTVSSVLLCMDHRRKHQRLGKPGKKLENEVSPRRRSGRSEKTQGAVYLILAAWLLASMVSLAVFYATGSRRVMAMTGTTILPDDIAEDARRALGLASAYKDIGPREYQVLRRWMECDD